MKSLICALLIGVSLFGCKKGGGGGTAEIVKSPSLDLVGEYILLGFEVQEAGMAPFSEEDFSSWSGMMSIGLDGVVYQKRTIEGETEEREFQFSLYWQNEPLNTVALCTAFDLESGAELFDFTLFVEGMELEIEAVGFGYIENTQWEKISNIPKH